MASHHVGSIANMYTPLDASQQEIRLLEIISPPSQDLPTYQLTTVSLRTNPSFCALSYVWGDPKMTEDISVNNTTRSVTTNLVIALKYSHFHWQKTFPGRDLHTCRLWADAICINQADDKEKSHQVQMMKDIYTSAELVFSCLDARAEDSRIPLAFNVFAVISKEAEASGFRPSHDDQMVDLSWTARYPTLFQPESSDGFQCATDVYNALDDLLNLRYWKRAWIFQEIVLASRAFIVCEFLSVELDSILYARYWTMAARKQTLPEDGPPSAWRSFTNVLADGLLFRIDMARLGMDPSLSSTATDHERLALRHAIAFFGGKFDATNPKDHVYAFLGINNFQLIPDYSKAKSVALVYVDFCIEFLKRHGRPSTLLPLQFLYLSGTALLDTNQQSDYLPSWVPNFPRIRTVRSLNWPVGPFQKARSPGFQHDTTLPWYYPEPNKELYIRGLSLFVPVMIIGAISDISPTLTNAPDSWPGVGWAIIRMIKKLHLENRSRHPLLCLAGALGMFGDEVDIWKSPEVLQSLRMLQGLLMVDVAKQVRAASAVDQRSLKSKLFDQVLGEGFLSDVGLGSDWIAAQMPALQSSVEACLNKSGVDWEHLAETHAEFAAPLRFLRDITQGFAEPKTLDEMSHNLSLVYGQRARLCQIGRDDMGLVPGDAATGDLICLLKGSNWLSVLRRVDNHYLHVGSCSSPALLERTIGWAISNDPKTEWVELR